MKYVVNSRGRTIQVSKEEVKELLASGRFTEITMDQFEKGYLVEYDQGPNHQVKTTNVPKKKAQIQSNQIERDVLETVIV